MLQILLMLLTNNGNAETIIYTSNLVQNYSDGNSVCVAHAAIEDAANPPNTITCTGVTSEPPGTGNFFFDLHVISIASGIEFEVERTGIKTSNLFAR